MIEMICRKCGVLGFYSSRSYKEVSKVVDEHKIVNGQGHSIKVKRDD